MKRRNFIKSIGAGFAGFAGIASIPLVSVLANGKSNNGLLKAEHGWETVGDVSIRSNRFTFTEDSMRVAGHLTTTFIPNKPIIYNEIRSVELEAVSELDKDGKKKRCIIPIMDLTDTSVCKKIDNESVLKEKLIKACKKDPNDYRYLTTVYIENRYLTTVYIENRPELIGLMVADYKMVPVRIK